MIEAMLKGAGGLGLFLLGMHIMTDGLRVMAGGALRRWLGRFTKSPLSGAATGAAATAMIQSSSATTVTAVGFVGAGLLTFPQALGVIFGANLGTTITGWMVALLGFKLKLGTLVMPLILLGALGRLFGRGKIRSGGMSLAGFGLIFVGISSLQSGLAGLEGVVTPTSFPSDTWGGRVLLVLIGILITLITQSSSAGVATAMTAVHTGSISLSQGAAMVIGMDIGTTFTAVLATVGGSTAAKRTGYAHVIYNLMTGVVAFLCLGLYIGAWEQWAPLFMQNNPETVLVAFHTVFNAAGVVAVLPFSTQFAGLIERLVPDQHDHLSESLDRSLLREPTVAIAAASHALRQLTGSTCHRLCQLSDSKRVVDPDPPDLGAAVLAVRTYTDLIQPSPDDPTQMESIVQLFHTLDHVDRLIDRCQQTARAETARTHDPLAAMGQSLTRAIHQLQPWLEGNPANGPETQCLEIWQQLESQREPFRQKVIREAAHDHITDEQTDARLEAFRWLRRVAYHLWRIVHHLERVEYQKSKHDAPPVETIDAEMD